MSGITGAEAYCIRPMEEEDVPAVTLLERACFSDAWSEHLLREMLRSSWDSAAVMTAEDGTLLGYINIRVLGTEAELMRICVRPESRGQRLSVPLLRSGLREMLCRSASEATLEVRNGNTAAVRLYEAHGFVLEGVRKNYYSAPVEDALIYWNRTLREVFKD